MERLVKTTLRKHLKANDFIKSNQHGFVKHDLLETIDIITLKLPDRHDNSRLWKSIRKGLTQALSLQNREILNQKNPCQMD
jgi:hypothetical protein